MFKPRDGLRASPLMSALVVLWIAALAAVAVNASGPGGAPPAKSMPAAPARSAQPPAQAGDYVGQDTCLTCHDDKNYKGTAHALVSNPRSPVTTQARKKRAAL